MRKNIIEFKRASFKRVLNVTDLFAIGYGDLGSSIYYALGITALYALGATPIALALAGFVFICTALTYAEMTSVFQESGGSASYARHAFNDLISFIAGWGLLLDYIVTIAISAFSVPPYLSYFFPDFKLIGVQTGFSVGLIAILFLVNVFGVRQSTRISFILASVTIITQGLIILIGAVFLFNLPYIFSHMQINILGMDWSPTWPEFWKGTAMAMVAYTGIESIAQLGAEAKIPSKTVPKSIMITMFFLVAIYIGISVTALSAMSPQQLGKDFLNDPIAGIVAHLPFAASFLRPWIGILGAIILIVAANAGLIGASRLSYNMGEYYQLPNMFRKLLPGARTPVIALAFFAFVAALVVVWSRGKLAFLADLYNFGAMLAFFFAHLSLLALRIKQPHLKRPFRAPLNIKFGKFSLPMTAIIGLLATASVWVLVVITKPEGRYLGFTWMILGLAMFFTYRYRKRLSVSQVTIEKIKIPKFESLSVNKILVITQDSANLEALQAACELAKLHRAEVTGFNLLEIPPSMPLDAELPVRVKIAEAALKNAKAIAEDLNVEANFGFLRTRSFSGTALTLAKEGDFDLMILGLDKKAKEKNVHYEKIITKAGCHVWICS